MNGAVVKTDEKAGTRHLEATKDIKAGEVIINEDALMTGPCGDIIYPICLSCYKVILNDCNLCNSCKWPTCTEACEKAAIHAKNECRIFKNAGVKPLKDPMYYFNITVLRCLLLKEANAKKFDALMQLYLNVGGGKPKKLMPPTNVSDFICKKCNKKEFDNDVMAKIAQIVGMYSFTTTDRLTLQSLPRMASLVFHHPGMMSHDCVPNTSWTRIENENNTFSIKVWATVDIKKGEKITTQFFDITRPHAERRFHLQETYNMVCACKRCSDPTELGTYYGAVKCPKCPGGYMISTDMSKGSDAEWKCEVCGEKQPYRQCAVPIETTIFEEIEKCGDETDFEKILETYAGKSVHPQHWLMQDCRLEIVKRLYGYVETIKPQEDMLKRAQTMLEYCKILKIPTDAFYPGYNRIQARLQLYILYAETLLKGEGQENDDQIENIAKLIRKGEELNIIMPPSEQ